MSLSNTPGSGFSTPQDSNSTDTPFVEVAIARIKALRQSQPVPAFDCPKCKLFTGIMVVGYPDKNYPWRWRICILCDGRGFEPIRGRTHLLQSQDFGTWMRARDRTELTFIALEIRRNAPSPSLEYMGFDNKDEAILWRKVYRMEIGRLIAEEEKTYGGKPNIPGQMLIHPTSTPGD